MASSKQSATAAHLAGRARESHKRGREEGAAQFEDDEDDATAGLMQATDAVLQGELDKLRDKGRVLVPRSAYAKLSSLLQKRADFLLALRAFHSQVGGLGAAVMAMVGSDGLLRSKDMPPIAIHNLFLAVAAGGGAANLQREQEKGWRRIAFVPGVLAASRAALADVSGLPAYVRKMWLSLLSGFEVVYALRVAGMESSGAQAGRGEG